jgi:hypothetical protein
MCDYDLRGQVEPRCPECGYRFVWDELRDPARRLHPYLFEHHPENNVGALLRTFAGGMRPRRFWRVLYPTQPSDPRRLVIYWAVIASVWLVACAAYFGWTIFLVDAQNRANRTVSVRWLGPNERAQIIQNYGSVQRWLEISYPTLPQFRLLGYVWNSYWMRPAMLTAFCIVAWPWLTLAALMVFQVSMRRAKVKPIHVMRCVIYSADALVLLLLALAPSLLSNVVRGRWGTLFLSGMFEIRLTGYALLFAATVITYRLWIAYRFYLRFEHALATVLASQVMVGLLVWKLGLDWHALSW